MTLSEETPRWRPIARIAHNPRMEPTEYDVRCSNACTRAGIALLILAALSFAMIRPVDKTRQLDALLKYTSARLTLKDHLVRLESDAAWHELMSTPAATEARTTWTLDKLLAYTFKESMTIESAPSREESTPTDVEQKRAAPSSRSKITARPAAPTGLGITFTREIEPLHRMVDALAELGNRETLIRARLYSPRADRAIFDWELLRFRLLPEGIGSREQLIKKLTLPHLVELANFAPPTASEAEALIKEQTSVTLPSLGVPIGLIPATTIVEFGTLLSLLYFWLYYREARRSPRFPADATLFGVFARTCVTRSAFFFLSALPPAAATTLAWKSFWVTRENAVIAVFVVVAAVLVQAAGPLPRTGSDPDADSP